jgi:hypothetical protein
MGTLKILSVGQGDIKITFDRNDIQEQIRAKRMVEEMLRRGYCLLVEQAGKMSRAVGFDPDTYEYIVADYDPLAATETISEPNIQIKQEEQHEPEIQTQPEATQKKRGPKPGTRRVKMQSANCYGVARSAGG